MTSSYVRATGADFAGLAALPLPNPSSRRAAAAAEARDSFFTAAALALLGAAIELHASKGIHWPAVPAHMFHCPESFAQGAWWYMM